MVQLTLFDTEILLFPLVADRQVTQPPFIIVASLNANIVKHSLMAMYFV